MTPLDCRWCEREFQPLNVRNFYCCRTCERKDRHRRESENRRSLRANRPSIFDPLLSVDDHFYPIHAWGVSGCEQCRRDFPHFKEHYLQTLNPYLRVNIPSPPA